MRVWTVGDWRSTVWEGVKGKTGLGLWSFVGKPHHCNFYYLVHEWLTDDNRSVNWRKTTDEGPELKVYQMVSFVCILRHVRVSYLVYWWTCCHTGSNDVFVLPSPPFPTVSGEINPSPRPFSFRRVTLHTTCRGLIVSGLSPFGQVSTVHLATPTALTSLFSIPLNQPRTDIFRYLRSDLPLVN